MSTPAHPRTPAAPARDADRRDRPREPGHARGRRFTRSGGRAGDTPTAPLVEEQQDPGLYAAAPIPARAVAAPERTADDWRATVLAASALNVVAGLWLVVAPFVLAYGGGGRVWNDVVCGAAVALLAVARVTRADRAAWLGWTIVVIGAWVFASAFWLDRTATAAINDVIVGSLIAAVGAASAMATHDAERSARAARRL